MLQGPEELEWAFRGIPCIKEIVRNPKALKKTVMQKP